MLEVQHINTGYGKKQVLFDVSLAVQEGEIGLLIGSNGSGKSTLLKCIYGLLHLWPGESGVGKVLFDQQDITKQQPHKLLKKGLVYVPQHDNLFEDLTVQENLEISGLKLPKKQFRESRDQVYEFFPQLKEYRKRTPFKMSGGERQMLAISLGLIHQPKLMLLDEPGSGLAPGLIHELLQKLKQLNQERNITMLLVEHRVKESLTIADRIFALKLGELYKTYQNHHTFEAGELNEVFV